MLVVCVAGLCWRQRFARAYVTIVPSHSKDQVIDQYLYVQVMANIVRISSMATSTMTIVLDPSLEQDEGANSKSKLQAASIPALALSRCIMAKRTQEQQEQQQHTQPV